MPTNKVVVFDLDDTLYKEVDFLKSAYREIADFIHHPEAYDFMTKCYLAGDNAFANVIEKYNLSLTIEQLLNIYRNHKPAITLDSSTTLTLNSLRDHSIEICLLTDGRSVAQRNKIDALDLWRWILPENILISEEFGCGKPDPRCYHHFMEKFPNATFSYFGDNTAKDFVTANQLGWTTICLLNNGQNIHPQSFELPIEYLPKYKIRHIEELLTIF